MCFFNVLLKTSLFLDVNAYAYAKRVAFQNSEWVVSDPIWDIWMNIHAKIIKCRHWTRTYTNVWTNIADTQIINSNSIIWYNFREK